MGVTPVADPAGHARSAARESRRTRRHVHGTLFRRIAPRKREESNTRTGERALPARGVPRHGNGSRRTARGPIATSVANY